MESMVNPFACNLDEKSIVNIHSGRVADEETTKDLKDAHSVGEEKFHKFLSENLLSETPNLFDPIKKNKLKTFAVKKKKTTKAATTLKASSVTKDLFARLLLLSNTREINLDDVLSKSLSTLPLSLGKPVFFVQII